MRRRGFIIGGAVLLTVATVIGQVIPRPRRPQVSREQFEKIKEGMSREEVEAIIGGPPGDYTTGQYYVVAITPTYVGGESWVGDGGLIRVWFDETGQADETHYFEIDLLLDPSVMDRVRAWLEF
jgi:hypothetical protein